MLGSADQEWASKLSTNIEYVGRGWFVNGCLQKKNVFEKYFLKTQKTYFEKVVYL